MIAPSASSFVEPGMPEEQTNEHLYALVIFDFTPTSEFELGVHGMLLLPYAQASTMTDMLLCRWYECPCLGNR